MKKTLTLLSILAMSGVMANAQVILSDAFTSAADGEYLTNRVPDISLSGALWMQPTAQLPGSSTTTAGFGNPIPGGIGGPQGASAVSIASAVLYTKPTAFTITADLAPSVPDEK